jgi:hypothetical protein
MTLMIQLHSAHEYHLSEITTIALFRLFYAKAQTNIPQPHFLF